MCSSRFTIYCYDLQNLGRCRSHTVLRLQQFHFHRLESNRTSDCWSRLSNGRIDCRNIPPRDFENIGTSALKEMSWTQNVVTTNKQIKRLNDRQLPLTVITRCRAGETPQKVKISHARRSFPQWWSGRSTTQYIGSMSGRRLYRKLKDYSLHHTSLLTNIPTYSAL